MSSSDTIELFNSGKYGINLDLPAHILPPQVWSNGNNVRMTKAGARRTRGHDQVFGAMSTTPEFIFNVPAVGASYWIYCSLTEAFVYESGIHTEITNTGADYTTAAGRDWNGAIIGGVPILNNGVDVPQYWSSLNPATPLSNLPNWPSTLRAKLIKAVGQYLVALNLVDDGVALPQAVAWSSKADPGTIPASWDPTDPTVETGRIQLTDIHGGQIVDAELLGDSLIIYKEFSIHAFRFVGNVDIFAPTLIISTAGAMTTRCACAYDKGTRHLVVTSDDIIIHQGTREYKSIAEDRVKEAIFGEMDKTNYVNSFVFDNFAKKEVWICYPTEGSTYPTKAAIWNYKDDNWTFRDFDGVSYGFGTLTESDSTVWDDDSEVWDEDPDPWSLESNIKQVYVNRTKALALEASTYTFDTAPSTAFVERTELSIDGKDREGNPTASLRSVKLVTRIWPRISGSAPMRIQVGSQNKIGGAITWASAQTFDPTVDEYLDWEVSGKLIAVRFENLTGEYFQIEGYGIDVQAISEL